MRISKNGVSRRTFLGGMIAGVVSPLWAVPSNPDVVVIGAGSAGLAAAQKLIEQGRTVIVVEAANRIGGRAHTESTTFGIPFDQGCSWVQGERNHPYVRMAREWGFDLLSHGGADEAFYVGNKRGSAGQTRKYYEAYEKVERLIEIAGNKGNDVAASSVIPDDLEYSGIAQSWIGPMDYGVDFKDLSTFDYSRYGALGSNYMVREGYGTIVTRFGSNLPVKLDTPVTGVDWSGNGVEVETSAGTIRARTCIVTVSTGVLSAGSIKFTPELPHWKQAAIDNLPMGLLAKIPLQFDGERFGLKANQWLSYWVQDEMPAEASYFLTWPFDFDLMIGFVGGEFGWQLSSEGSEAAVDFALGEVVRMFGGDARKYFVKGSLTKWASNPWTLGAYAAVRPGHFNARAELMKPVGERLFFAGEAATPRHFTLCAAAYNSGLRAAEEADAVLA